MANAIEAFDAKHMKPAEEIPAFRPGDTVDVNVKIQEGNPYPDLHRRGDCAQGCWRARDLRGPQGQLRHRRGASLPAALPGYRVHQARAHG